MGEKMRAVSPGWWWRRLGAERAAWAAMSTSGATTVGRESVLTARRLGQKWRMVFLFLPPASHCQFAAPGALPRSSLAISLSYRRRHHTPSASRFAAQVAEVLQLHTIVRHRTNYILSFLRSLQRVA